MNDPFYLNFDVWCIALFDYLKAAHYSPTREDIDILSGMYQCGMNAKEAAETFTASKTRVLTAHQLNLVIFAKSAFLFLESKAEALFVVGKSGDGHISMVTSPKLTPEDFTNAMKTLAEMLETMIEKKNKPKNNEPDS